MVVLVWYHQKIIQNFLRKSVLRGLFLDFVLTKLSMLDPLSQPAVETGISIQISVRLAK